MAERWSRCWAKADKRHRGPREADRRPHRPTTCCLDAGPSVSGGAGQGLELLRCLRARQQVDLALRVAGDDAGNEVGEMGLRVDADELAGFDKRSDDRPLLAAAISVATSTAPFAPLWTGNRRHPPLFEASWPRTSLERPLHGKTATSGRGAFRPDHRSKPITRARWRQAPSVFQDLDRTAKISMMS